MKLKLFLCAALAACVTAGLPAVAQFEVSPDHFPDPPQDHPVAGAQADPALQAKIAAMQSELDRFEAQIRHQKEAVENARELAAGVGGRGDSASVFIDDFLQKYRDLEQLERDLEPRIAQAQTGLDALNQLAAQRAVPVMAEHRAQKATTKATGNLKPAAAKRKSQPAVLSASARTVR